MVQEIARCTDRHQQDTSWHACDVLSINYTTDLQQDGGDEAAIAGVDAQLRAAPQHQTEALGWRPLLPDLHARQKGRGKLLCEPGRGLMLQAGQCPE